ncbi:ribonuclease H-like domain-containing protein [Tanacetum coccineum]|uniref:Ribonuclease H-like domain-containing protein n=1 Tax=Tanacetum coccineum TaxID=301880 RepID=A0ABQ4YWW3_9ASTR
MESDRLVPKISSGSSERTAKTELKHEGSKRQKTNEEQSAKEEKELSEKELQKLMMIVLVEEIYVEALQVKYPIIDWEVYSEETRKYWKIIRVRNHTEAYQTFDDMLKRFDKDDLDKLWSLVKERFSSTDLTDDKKRTLWVELKRLFEPDTDDILWKLQRYMHDLLTWRLYDTCGVHHVSTDRGHDIFMLVEKDYPLSKGVLMLMLVNKLLVEQSSEMANELLKKIFILANRPRQGGLLGIKGFYKFLLLVQLSTAKRRLSTAKLRINRPKHKVLDHGNLQQDLKNKGVIDSGCSRYMTGNRSYLIDYKEIDRGFVAFGGTKACNDASKARIDIVHGKDYILLPMWLTDPLFSQNSKDSPNVGFKPSGEEEKKDAKDQGNEDSKVPSTKEPKEDQRVNQELDASSNNTNNINTASDANITNNVNVVSLTVNAASIEDNAINENIVYGCANDPNMPELEDIIYSDDVEDVGAEADMNNLDTFMPVSPIPTTRIHKDHPIEQIIGDLNLAPQTRRMTKKEPNKVIQALKDPSWIEAMQEELLQFKNKKDERGIVIKNKARLVAQGYTQEEGIDYDEVFAPVVKIKEIRLFLAYASFKDFVVYQMDVKSAFLYGKIEGEVYVCQPLGFEDPDYSDRVYKVEKALYGLHHAPKACFSDVKTASTPMETHKPLLKDTDGEDVDEHLYRSMIGSLMYLTSSRPDIMFAVCACARFQVNPKSSHLYAVKRIFRYLKFQLKLALWYPKDSPFDLVAYTDSDYAGASLDRKSTTGGCQFLGCRLISWQCKKQAVVANSTTKAEYIAASNCCGQTKHIEIRHHYIRDSNEKKLIQMIKIHTDPNVADLLTKAFDVSRFQYLIASIGMLNL